MKNYKLLLRDFLKDFVRDFRVRNRYSQEYMAELLHESVRCYLDQEHGKYGFSTLTFVFLLLALSESDILHLIREFRALFEKGGQR